MKQICKYLAFLCVFNVAASPNESSAKTNKKTLIAHFLNILAQAALVISTKDKEKRMEAAAQAIASLSLIARIILGKDEADELKRYYGQENQLISLERTYQLLLQHEEFLEICGEKCDELNAAIEQVLSVYSQEKHYNQCCDACAS